MKILGLIALLSFCQQKGFSCGFNFSFPFLLTATFCLSFSDASLVSSQKKTSSVIWPRRQTKTPPPSCSTEPRGGGGGGRRGGGLPAQQQLTLTRKQDWQRPAPVAGFAGAAVVRGGEAEASSACLPSQPVRSAMEAALTRPCPLWHCREAGRPRVRRDPSELSHL